MIPKHDGATKGTGDDQRRIVAMGSTREPLANILAATLLWSTNPIRVEYMAQEAFVYG